MLRKIEPQLAARRRRATRVLCCASKPEMHLYRRRHIRTSIMYFRDLIKLV